MTTATELFDNALVWFAEHYGNWRFFQERDLVWVLQTRVTEDIAKNNLPYRVFHGHKIRDGESADLAILQADESVQVAAEFKYEPSHGRSSKAGGDIWAVKFPVVFWTGIGSVEKDVQRVKNYVEAGKAKAGYSIFVDEGRHFRGRDPFPGSEWVDWQSGVSVLRSRTPPFA